MYCNNCGDHISLPDIPREEFDKMRETLDSTVAYAQRNEDSVRQLHKVVAEMQEELHEVYLFIKALSGALDNPMVKAMIPANMRDKLG